MDSQGFVRLSFIASFKRIKNLTEDYELLRHSGRQLRNVEYILGDDGQDRLRPRDKWEQWVLPIDQRDPSAQNEGYPSASFHPVEDQMAVHNGIAQNGYQPVSNGFTNGIHQHADSRTTLSSAAPEFTPYAPVGSQNEIPNVGLHK
jgi:la-related protein 1